MNTLIKSIFLRPASLVYGVITGVRNKLYDLNLLHSADTEITSIGIGNITVGGTGKTPHTEYLIRHITGRHEVAYLSRGYKRKSRGFVLADSGTGFEDIGDEANQIARKFDITVAVDANRRRGISKIKEARPGTEVVLLDDIYQHRSIHPDLNILLIDYNRPLHTDSMLPYGQLRESSKNSDRADIIIITKCPENMQPVDMLTARVQINPYPYQNLYFTTIGYHAPRKTDGSEAPDLTGYDLLVVTGIARPEHLNEHLKQYTDKITHIAYADHHAFTADNIRHITDTFNKLQPNKRAIVITEKDFARLDAEKLPDEIRQHTYVIAIEPRFLFDMNEKFDQEIDKFITLRCTKNKAKP